jgi:hypothetical protein
MFRKGLVSYCEGCAIRAEATRAEHDRLTEKMDCGHPVACLEGERMATCSACRLANLNLVDAVQIYLEQRS